MPQAAAGHPQGPGVAVVGDHAQAGDPGQLPEDRHPFGRLPEEVEEADADGHVHGAVGQGQAEEVRHRQGIPIVALLLPSSPGLAEHGRGKVGAQVATAAASQEAGEAAVAAGRVEDGPVAGVLPPGLAQEFQGPEQGPGLPPVAPGPRPGGPAAVVVPGHLRVPVVLELPGPAGPSGRLGGGGRRHGHQSGTILVAMAAPAPADLPPLPARPAAAHKGSMGRVLLMAGSRGLAGAAIFAAKAALRGGAGYVVVAAPGSIATELTLGAPGAVLRLAGDLPRPALYAADLDLVLEELRRATAAVLGPGLGTSDQTAELLLTLLRSPEVQDGRRPLVLDADALNILAARDLPLARLLPPTAILTPHPGEAARLLGLPGGAAVQADRPGTLRALVAATGAVVLLKGAGTLVGAPDQEPWENSSGNPGMATAGSGDVLAGLLGALLARGLPPWDAARLGAWLHGRAGDLAAEALGEEGLIAADLLPWLPRALAEHPRATPEED